MGLRIGLRHCDAARAKRKLGANGCATATDTQLVSIARRLSKLYVYLWLGQVKLLAAR